MQWLRLAPTPGEQPLMPERTQVVYLAVLFVGMVVTFTGCAVSLLSGSTIQGLPLFAAGMLIQLSTLAWALRYRARHRRLRREPSR